MKFYYIGESKKVVFGRDLDNLEGLKEIKVNSVDAALEKHVPSYEIIRDEVLITVGEVIHPMLDNHYIEFILVETNLNVYVKYLKPGEEPKALFKLNEGEKVINIYEYCNLHGLWVKKVN